MSFLTRWLRPVDEVPMITVDAHKDIVAETEKQLQAERDTVGRLVLANRALKIENAGLRNDVRQAEAAHDKAVSEIAHWKKHGQLRDPATGRLIPKAKASDTFTASHTPA